MYDTYGFPTDLTELILREQRIWKDLEGFARESKNNKERARSAQVEATDWHEVHEETEFTGYDQTSGITQILRYREVTAKKQKSYQVVLSQSPFYAEMGGQVGDRGNLTGKESGEVLQVIDTIRENNLPICVVDKLPARTPRSYFFAEIGTRKRRQTGGQP